MPGQGLALLDEVKDEGPGREERHGIDYRNDDDGDDHDEKEGFEEHQVLRGGRGWCWRRGVTLQGGVPWCWAVSWLSPSSDTSCKRVASLLPRMRPGVRSAAKKKTR